MEVGPHHTAGDFLRGFDEVMMVVPIDAHIDEAQYVGKEHGQERFEGFKGDILRHVQIQHHDGDDDGQYTVAKGFQAVLFHGGEMMEESGRARNGGGDVLTSMWKRRAIEPLTLFPSPLYGGRGRRQGMSLELSVVQTSRTCCGWWSILYIFGANKGEIHENGLVFGWHKRFAQNGLQLGGVESNYARLLDTLVAYKAW